MFNGAAPTFTFLRLSFPPSFLLLSILLSLPPPDAISSLYLSVTQVNVEVKEKTATDTPHPCARQWPGPPAEPS
ncbi:hypothetical protein XELAEV_18018330mg [Xenopus laevis]|uniref:Secreted protein n=1 Tax=Xenopus laevis TaxID=8355 RepID=A0A974DEU3_XENLA|nr:hypothetical protein XELAEV_18018330mg [Xenopus laevis]